MKEGNFQRNWSCVEKWKIYMILLKSFFSFEYVFSNLKKDKTKEIFEEIDWKKKKEEYI